MRRYDQQIDDKIALCKFLKTPKHLHLNVSLLYMLLLLIFFVSLSFEKSFVRIMKK